MPEQQPSYAASELACPCSGALPEDVIPIQVIPNSGSSVQHTVAQTATHVSDNFLERVGKDT